MWDGALNTSQEAPIASAEPCTIETVRRLIDMLKDPLAEALGHDLFDPFGRIRVEMPVPEGFSPYQTVWGS